MSSQHDPPDLNALADALRVLNPRPAALDRDAIMFRAGRASARRGWLWPGVSAALLLICLGLAWRLAQRPQAVVEGRILHIPTEPPPRSSPAPEPESLPVVHETAPEKSEPPGGDDYLRLRQRVVDHGVEALPPVPAWPAPAPFPGDSLLDGADSVLRRRHQLFSGGAS